MAAQNKKNAVAMTYARAMLELANAQNVVETVEQEMGEVRKVVEAEPKLAIFLSDPAISHADRSGVIEHAFAGKLSPLMMNFLRVAAGKARLGLLSEIAQAFQALLDKQRGLIDVDVTVAQSLDPAMLEEVRQRIGAALNKQPVIHEKVNAAILGGIVLKIEDKLIDGSVRAQLEAMRQRLMAGGK